MYGNSFVAFLLGITDYNPIDYNLPFEMFAGKKLDKEPDIDLNFSYEIQEKIHEYIAEKYGKDKVIYCGTVATITERTIMQWIKKYSEDLNIEINEKDKKEIARKLAEIKKGTGVHPGGILILPKNRDIKEFTPIESYKLNERKIVKTHYDYHSIYTNFHLYKFDVLGHDTPTILHRLKEITKIDPKDIDLNDGETLAVFLNSKEGISTRGIPEFGTEFMINVLKEIKPKNFNDLVCVDGLSHGTGTWTSNAEKIIKNRHVSVEQVISTRADIMNFLMSKGIERELAYDITEFIRKGKASRDKEKYDEYKEIMEKHNIPEWYIESAKLIKYLFPKSHSIGYTIDAFRIAWYKVHYPEAFYKVYFEVRGDIDISKYTNKKQVVNKIKRLEELDEERYEIDELKILLEMYTRGIRKDEERKLDNYDLINSVSIGDYCREIEYKFNTEELAVLIHRNQKMDIDEKIIRYKDLLDNYPDMEVIERINCKHYDSVKTMIKDEIERLKYLKKKLQEKDESAIYSYEMYYTSTRKWDKPWNVLETIRTTFDEIDKEIKNDIEEYNDTLVYRISKRYLNKEQPTITAEYQVIDKKRILTNIHDSENNFLDIDNIFLNIPTPFKKGDLLVSWENTPYREGLVAENKDIFVLDWLCTWKGGLTEYLSKGNCDSSDMIGYGYYMYEDSDEFVRDNKWDYDHFEYYDGELKGIYRTLKAISSFLKNKIELEIFVHAYEEFKAENRISLIDWYNEEGLKLAGCSETDILRYKENDKRKRCIETEEEKLSYLKYHTYGFYDIDEKDIKQIEINEYNYVYVLLNNGDLYKDGEKISSDIDRICIFDREHIYKITTDNKIISLQEIYTWNDWDNIDKYLNNNNCSYKKIITNSLYIIALTEKGDIKSIYGGNDKLGIISENFIDVDDIKMIEEEPYIIKSNEIKPLYIN